MQASEIRDAFLSFFRKKGHKVLPSFPLTPIGDKSLLLINAGMAPMKAYFLGDAEPIAPKIATCQKCVRVIDIDKVGKTDRHLTFFEMLGNFSFGDYFKDKAIPYALELLTQDFHLPQEKLCVTIYQEDDEAEKIWRKIGFPQEKIFRKGKADNFWMAGETGPCGPDSEIFFDRGESFSCHREVCEPGCDCDRYLEVWNLVFMQYNRSPEGSLAPLPQKNIDTGMGLERLTLLLQDKQSLYDTDLFAPLIHYLKELKEGVSPYFCRVVSDHIRSTVHLIADGVFPSNESRGYILRRLIRKAVLEGKKEGLTPFFAKLVPLVIQLFAQAYPSLKEQADTILTTVREEEERFLLTLDQGRKLFFEAAQELKNKGKKTLSGETAFKLYDTYGFPLDLTRELSQEEGLALDEKGFEKALALQKERSRLAVQKESWRTENLSLPSVQFVGYDTLSTEAEVLAILKGNQAAQVVNVGEEAVLLLSPTPFYAEGGGQVGDIGEVRKEGTLFVVTDCQKPKAHVHLHKGKMQEGTLRVGDKVIATVDPKARLETARHHTGTHLLHAVLREVLGKEVKQAGSFVCPDYLRFDFTFHRAVSQNELIEIEKKIHRYILEDYPVGLLLTDYDQAQEMGALAFFDEKYGQKVRVVKIGNVSLELCGGTHLQRSLQVGCFTLLKEEGIGAGIRRIEALCGEKSFAYTAKAYRVVKQATQLLQCRENQVEEKIRELLEEKKVLVKQAEKIEQKLLHSQAAEWVKKKKQLKGLEVLLLFLSKDAKQGKALAQAIQPFSLDLLLLLIGKGERFHISAHCSKRAIDRGVQANDIVQWIAQQIGGSGGGKPEAAYGGGKAIEHPEKVIALAEKEIQKMLEVKQ